MDSGTKDGFGPGRIETSDAENRVCFVCVIFPLYFLVSV
jgi:hypothetical protein